MQRIKVWDPFVRVFHWSLVTLFALNSLIVEEGKLHEWIGYAVVALVLTRVAWGLVGTRYARFSSFPPSLAAARAQLAGMFEEEGEPHIGHTPLGGLMIYNLILTILVIGLSGWMMTTDAFWGLQWPEDLHMAAVTWAEISVLMHIAAVFYESRRTRVNLPRAMVTGYKELPSR